MELHSAPRRSFRLRDAIEAIRVSGPYSYILIDCPPSLNLLTVNAMAAAKWGGLGLLADAQTIGGYPQLAHVISVDLPLLAQLRPGDAVRFRVVSIELAQERWLAREQALAMLREGLAQKIR
jgi:hypothetical protein